MLANFVQETANAPGTAATINLGGAVSGRLPFIPTFASGSSVFYGLDDGTQAEMGIGVVNAGSPNTLTRTTVLWNSAGTTARMNFLGTVRAYCSVPAERAVYAMGSAPVAISSFAATLLDDADAAAARTTLGATTTGAAVFTAADQGAARTAIGATTAAYADTVAAAAPSTKAEIRTGSWGGVFDLQTTDTSFFDITLPDDTAHVIGSGYVHVSQPSGSLVGEIFTVQVLNGALSVIQTHTACIMSSIGSAVAASGLEIGLTIPAGNTGHRLRFLARKDAAIGPTNLLNYSARVLCVTR